MSGGLRVSVVVVSFQVRDLLRRCLTSIAAQDSVDVEAWVVDNDSDDGSADMVAREFPWVRLLRNARNVGFASANNQALRQAGGDILLLLNPDTELPPGALAALGGVFRRHPRAGAVGLALVHADGSPQAACHAFPGVLNLLAESVGLHRALLRFGYGTAARAPVPRGGEGEVDWVGGACMALSRQAYARVGGLNEDLFMYGEEMDWSWRARRLGFATVFSQTVRVLHHGGASGAGLRGPLFVRNIASRVDFLRRYRGAWRAIAARELLWLASLLRLAVWAPRAWLEQRRGEIRPWTRDQVERFRAVIAWRFGAVR